MQEGLTVRSRNVMHMNYASNDGLGLKSNTGLLNHIFGAGKVLRRLILVTVSRNYAVSIAVFFFR